MASVDELTEAIAKAADRKCDISVTFVVHEIWKQAQHLSSTESFDQVMKFFSLKEPKMQSLLRSVAGASVIIFDVSIDLIVCHAPQHVPLIC